jgi:glutaredoxin
MDTGLFSSITGKQEFVDGNHLYRLSKYDVTQRFQPSEVPPASTYYLSVHGFKGCPFCRRAIDAAEALAAEVGPQVLLLDALEHENRVDYSNWLGKKKNDLAKNYAKVVYHTSSPIVYTTDTDRYIGGLDEMLAFLLEVPQFCSTKALKKYKVQSPVSTFVRGLPIIAKNLKSTLPF